MPGEDILIPDGRELVYVERAGEKQVLASTLVGQTPFIATGGNTARSAADRWSDCIRPEDEGAVGNGVADDTAALRSAITKAASSGKYVRAEKRYKLTDYISLVGTLLTGGGELVLSAADARIHLGAAGKCVGMKITGNAVDAPGAVYIIGDAAVCERNVFSNCLVGVYIEQIGAYGPSGAQIHDNQFIICYTGVLAIRMSYGSIKGNFIQGVKGITNGIQMWGSINSVISGNVVAGGVTGIACVVNPAYSGICPFQGNTISGNVVTNISEESISLDGRYNGYPNAVFEMDTVKAKSLSSGTPQIQMNSANWGTAGVIGQYASYWITFTTGALVGQTFFIKSQPAKDAINVQIPTVSGRSAWDAVNVGDEFVIGLPMFNNTICGNTIEISAKYGSAMPTGIVLWGYACGNTVSGNVVRRGDTNGDTDLDCDGLILANLSGITYGTSVTQVALKAPCMRNMISGNSCGEVQANLINGLYGSSYNAYGNLFAGNRFDAIYGDKFENLFASQSRVEQVTNKF